MEDDDGDEQDGQEESKGEREWEVEDESDTNARSFEYEVLPILSKFNHFLSPLVVSRN